MAVVEDEEVDVDAVAKISSPPMALVLVEAMAGATATGTTNVEGSATMAAILACYNLRTSSKATSPKTTN